VTTVIDTDTLCGVEHLTLEMMIKTWTAFIVESYGIDFFRPQYGWHASSALVQKPVVTQVDRPRLIILPPCACSLVGCTNGYSVSLLTHAVTEPDIMSTQRQRLTIRATMASGVFLMAF
jgi:hypothetical protein